MVFIDGRIVDKTGFPVSGVRVGLSRPGIYERTIWTGADGSFRFDEAPETTWTLNISKEGYYVDTSGSLAMTVYVGYSPINLGNISVNFVPAPPPPPPTPTPTWITHYEADSYVWDIYLDVDGTYFGIERTGRFPQVRGVSLQDVMNKIDALTLVVPKYSVTLDITPKTVVPGTPVVFAGKLLEDGSPLPNVDVELWALYPPPSPQEWLWLGILFTTDVDGEYRESVGTTGLKAGTYGYKVRYTP